ncbi:MAG: hypothetical protein ACYCZN_01405 [Candidatus Dormibacteria bacterium]
MQSMSPSATSWFSPAFGSTTALSVLREHLESCVRCRIGQLEGALCDTGANFQEVYVEALLDEMPGKAAA